MRFLSHWVIQISVINTDVAALGPLSAAGVSARMLGRLAISSSPEPSRRRTSALMMSIRPWVGGGRGKVLLVLFGPAASNSQIL